MDNINNIPDAGICEDRVQKDLQNTASTEDSQGKDSSDEEDFLDLQYRCPEPGEEFTGLSPALINRLVYMVMDFVDRLCSMRGSSVDRKYWKHITEDVLKSMSDHTPLVCPARAGYGKSTWILAFILAMCSLYVNHDPLADILGGVMVVLQKVETLNEIVAAVSEFFPKAPPELAIAWQGWTLSGQAHGFCENPQVSNYQECLKDKCPRAVTCKLLQFNQMADKAYILCITQARFDMIRKTGLLDLYLTRKGGSSPRRFAIFDEKFNFAPMQRLTMKTINDASSELEELVRRRGAKDSSIGSMQNRLDYYIKKYFRDLRSATKYELDDQSVDSTLGLCSLRDRPSCEKMRFKDYEYYIQGHGKRYRTKNLSVCLEVIDALFQGECLYTKTNGFSILHAEEPQIVYGDALTLVFDATAEVDGDYRHLGARFLASSPIEQMEQVTFYVYTHQDLNVSRTSMQKPWKLPAFCRLIEEILDLSPKRTFLCTYKDFADYFPDHISADVQKRILLMPGKDPACVPYWGGNNGSNEFNMAQNCILIGYPRLDVRTYLEQTYTYWKSDGILDQINSLSEKYQSLEGKSSSFIQNDIPAVQEYEAYHLAARLEQEIYRCKLRNKGCKDPIGIFLFSPPHDMLDILLKRFPGAKVKYIEELPDCVSHAKGTTRTYNDEPTFYAKFVHWVENKWNGEPISAYDLRSEAGISDSGWKALLKGSRFKSLKEKLGLYTTGRGANVMWHRHNKRGDLYDL